MKEHKQYYRLKQDLPDIKAGALFKRIELSLGMRAFYVPVEAKTFKSKFEIGGHECLFARVGNASAHVFAQMYVEQQQEWFEVVEDGTEFELCPNCETVNEFKSDKKSINCKVCQREIKLVSIN